MGKSSKFILLDIGGGSTEIIINNDKDYISHSFNFGIVTLTQKHYGNEELHEYLDLKKLEIKNFLIAQEIELSEYTFVATAGTPTTIAAIKLGQDFFHYDKNMINGTSIDLNDLNNCLNVFHKSNSEDITKLVGSGRVEFIEVGIYIYKAIFEVLQKSASIVLDDGLREGVAINSCLLRD